MRSRKRSLTALVLAVLLLALSVAYAFNQRTEARETLDRSLTNEVNQEVLVLSNYFERARSIIRITAQNPVFKGFYEAPGSRLSKVRAQGPSFDETNRALEYLETLYPTSIGEACFIDQSGPENSRVVRGVWATPKDLSPDESPAPFFAPTFALDDGEVYQAEPYVSPDTGEWVISNSTLVPAVHGSNRAIVHFEVTIEAFRREAAAAAAKGTNVSVVDAKTGAVIIDSGVPQRLGAPLGPRGKLRLRTIVRGTADSGLTSLNGMPSAYRHVSRTPHNANRWIVVATSRVPALPFGGFGVGPVSLFVAVLFILMAAILNYRVSEKRLQRSEARFRSLVQNSSDLTLVLDSAATVTYASPTVERILNRSPEEVVTFSVYDLIHPDDRHSSRAILDDIADRPGGMGRVEVRCRESDGSWRWIEAMVTNQLQDPTVGAVVLNCRDISERKGLEEELEHQAFHDALTGLPNRALFKNRIEHALARRNLKKGSIALLFVDLDDFKTVNDTLGHSVGDQLLVAVGDRLSTTLRPADTLSRLGGDEFAALLEDMAHAGDALVVAERIVKALQAPFVLDDREVFIHASIGIVSNPSEEEAPDGLMRDADLAMYMAKNQGKGRYEVFERTMHTSLVKRQALKNDLQRAVDRGEFTLHYQPIVELSTGGIRGVEALLRWDHPERGLIPPMEFIPLAEETGLIHVIGRWVLREATQQVRSWQREFENAPNLSLNVNVSAKQMREASLVQDVSDALRDSGLPEEHLTLEITESLLMQGSDIVIARLEELKQLGVRLAIDDFGTGYSSLAYLRRFPIDTLKIDKVFVDGVTVGPEESALAHAVLKLSEVLGMECVAEGIETSEQVPTLRTMGCEVGQGYHFSRPLAANAISSLLSAQVPATV